MEEAEWLEDSCTMAKVRGVELCGGIYGERGVVIRAMVLLSVLCLSLVQTHWTPRVTSHGSSKDKSSPVV